MHALLAAHSLIAQPLHSTARFVGMLAPPASGSSGASAPLAGPGHADPLIVGIALVGIGVLYALVLLVAVVLLHRPRHLKWPGEADQAHPPSERGATGRPTYGYRPLAAHRAPGAQPPVCGPPGSTHAGAGDLGHDIGVAGDSKTLGGSSAHAPAPRPDGSAWRPVEYEVPEVGLVSLDVRTVHVFAGQPDVLRRLAFQRWRYQAGHCSEFAVPDKGTHAGEGARGARNGGQTGARSDGQGGSGGAAGGSAPQAPRQTDARQPWRPGRGAPVSHPTSGGTR